MVVSLLAGVSPHVTSIDVNIATQESTFGVTMGVWTDDTFTTLVADDFVVQVPETIFISAALSDGETGLIIQGRKCWATPR